MSVKIGTVIALSEGVVDEKAMRQVPNDYVFDTVATRDSYFTQYPEELVLNTNIIVQTPFLLQSYKGDGVWQDISAIVNGKDGKDGKDGKNGSEAIDENGVLYWDINSKENPAIHDIRLLKDAQYLDFERYDGNDWTFVASLGGSLSTDDIHLVGDFCGITNFNGNDVNNVWRITSTPNGNEVGDSKKTLFLVCKNPNDLKISFSPTPETEEVQQLENGSTNLSGVGSYEKTFIPTKDLQITNIKHNLHKETRARLIITDVLENRKVYETIDSAEFYETGGVLLKDATTELTTGLISAKLKNVCYLIGGRTYKIEIQTKDSGYIGNSTSNFPYTEIIGVAFVSEIVASREWVEDTYSYKRGATLDTYYLKGNATEIGSIRAKVIDGKVHYEELTSEGWDIANVYDIKLGARGLLSERLDALENAREFKGALDATGALEQLKDATDGSYWIVDVAGTLAGVVLSINDMVICHTPIIGTPIDLSGFAVISSTIEDFVGATPTADGSRGLVPRPLKEDTSKFLKATGEWATPDSKSFYGDVKQSFVQTDHGGWVLLNGRSVSTLTATQIANANALGMTSIIPDMTGKYAIGTPNGKFVGDSVGSNLIKRTDLPNVNVTANTGINDISHSHSVQNKTLGTSLAGGNHTHSVDPPATTSGNQSANHTHSTTATDVTSSEYKPSTYLIKSDAVWSYEGGSGIDGSSYNYIRTQGTPSNTQVTHTHTVSVPALTTGNNSANHTHTVNIASFNSGSTSTNHVHSVEATGLETFPEDVKHRHSVSINLNGNVTQTEFKPESVAMNMFIYLGE